MDGNVVVITVSDVVISALEDAAATGDIDVKTMVSLILNDWVLRRNAILRKIRK